MDARGRIHDASLLRPGIVMDQVDRAITDL
jgi:hypothetical protein